MYSRRVSKSAQLESESNGRLPDGNSRPGVIPRRYGEAPAAVGLVENGIEDDNAALAEADDDAIIIIPVDELAAPVGVVGVLIDDMTDGVDNARAVGPLLWSVDDDEIGWPVEYCLR
jgi:hypothetical protein